MAKRRLKKDVKRAFGLIWMWMMVLAVLSTITYLAMDKEARYGIIPKGIVTDNVPDPVSRRVVFKAGYQKDQQVMLRDTARSELLKDFRYRVGRIVSSQTVNRWGRYETVYDVKFNETDTAKRVSQTELMGAKTQFVFDQTVGWLTAEGYYSYDGQISEMKIVDGVTYYEVTSSQAGELSDLTAESLAYIYELKLLETNTAAENNALIQTALDATKAYSHTLINFPSGSFKIGSSNPDHDYIKLTSNTELRSHDTTLVVEGAARWYGFATGFGAVDGVTNFTMVDFNVVASDLTNGNQFIIMANHGNNWYVVNNTFTMVHKMGSHIFDLGGVQNAYFGENSFVGYAPELSGKTKIGTNSKHDFYSEAIQLDKADQSAWDGNYLRKIDTTFIPNNIYEHISSNITIVNNQFLPYINSAGQVVAYSATIGQHSSNVGYVEIIGNYFEAPLVHRVKISSKDPDAYLFEPVHFKSVYDSLNYDNVVVN